MKSDELRELCDRHARSIASEVGTGARVVVACSDELESAGSEYGFQVFGHTLGLVGLVEVVRSQLRLRVPPEFR